MVSTSIIIRREGIRKWRPELQFKEKYSSQKKTKTYLNCNVKDSTANGEFISLGL